MHYLPESDAGRKVIPAIEGASSLYKDGFPGNSNIPLVPMIAFKGFRDAKLKLLEGYLRDWRGQISLF